MRRHPHRRARDGRSSPAGRRRSRGSGSCRSRAGRAARGRGWSSRQAPVVGRWWSGAIVGGGGSGRRRAGWSGPGSAGRRGPAGRRARRCRSRRLRARPAYPRRDAAALALRRPSLARRTSPRAVVLGRPRPRRGAGAGAPAGARHATCRASCDSTRAARPRTPRAGWPGWASAPRSSAPSGATDRDARSWPRSAGRGDGPRGAAGRGPNGPHRDGRGRGRRAQLRRRSRGGRSPRPGDLRPAWFRGAGVLHLPGVLAPRVAARRRGGPGHRPGPDGGRQRSRSTLPPRPRSWPAGGRQRSAWSAASRPTCSSRTPPRRPPSSAVPTSRASCAFAPVAVVKRGSGRRDRRRPRPRQADRAVRGRHALRRRRRHDRRRRRLRRRLPGRVARRAAGRPRPPPFGARSIGRPPRRRPPARQRRARSWRWAEAARWTTRGRRRGVGSAGCLLHPRGARCRRDGAPSRGSQRFHGRAA